jgi:hypothetical protein
VATRWNSTLQMMRRARKLRPALQHFVDRYPEEGVQTLTSIEWKHIDYLIEILYPFSKFTNAISKSADTPTIHQVFAVYNSLFDHLEDQITLLERKRVLWKVKIRDALKKGVAKLKEYYSKTQNTLGHLYAVATIIAPEHKLVFFESEAWEEKGNRYYWVRLGVTKIVTFTNINSRSNTETILSNL